MLNPIAATALLEPIPRRPIRPKAAARFPAAFRALFRFPTRTVRKPQEVVILVTIEACLMVDTDDRRRSSMPRCAGFASAGIAVGERCAHGMNRNPRYEAREEQS